MAGDERLRRAPRDAEEAYTNLLKTGRTPDQIRGIRSVINQGIENGNLRGRISCSDHVSGFFEMARRVFVQDGEVRLSDAELGMHEGLCESPVCIRLRDTYYRVLKNSTEDESERIGHELDKLQEGLLKGQPLEDIIGRPSGLYDSETDESLPIVWAVDITGLGHSPDGLQTILKYTNPKRGRRVEVNVGATNVGYFVDEEDGLMQPGDYVFQRRAEDAGIDPSLLRDIIKVNAPIS